MAFDLWWFVQSHNWGHPLVVDLLRRLFEFALVNPLLPPIPNKRPPSLPVNPSPSLFASLPPAPILSPSCLSRALTLPWPLLRTLSLPLPLLLNPSLLPSFCPLPFSRLCPPLTLPFSPSLSLFLSLCFSPSLLYSLLPRPPLSPPFLIPFPGSRPLCAGSCSADERPCHCFCFC